MAKIRMEIDLGDGWNAEEMGEAQRVAREGAILLMRQLGVISLRKAAELLGVTYYELVDRLEKYGLPLCNVESDPEAVAALKSARERTKA